MRSVAAAAALALAASVPAQDPWAQAADHGTRARDALRRCRAYVHGWLREASDPLTGLFPSNLKNRAVWEPHNAAADNYAFMVLSTALVEPDLFRTRMRHILETETLLTSRVGPLPDSYDFVARRFVHEQVDLPRVIFAASEYAKDGLMPIHELLGETPWSERLRTIVAAIWERAPVATPDGPIPSANHEVAGELMQVTARLFWISGDPAWLDRACRLADHFLRTPGNHPTRDAALLRLRDHGCELISGLSEVYFACRHARPAAADAYREPLCAMLDRILEVGLDEHGMMFDAVNPRTGEVVGRRLSDNWGYNYNAFYTVHLADGVERYRDATRRALAGLAAHYRNQPWEGDSADGYADAIEGALNLYARETAFGDAAGVPGWIDSEIEIMFGKQREDGIVEGWHGDGNFARTALIYALWKQQGCRAEPWRDDLELGAVRDGDGLCLSLRAARPWRGRILFDAPRHRTVMRMPADYPRINQFPQWFTVDDGATFAVEVDGAGALRTGEQLRRGLEVAIETPSDGPAARIRVTPAR
jgi:hypothetical protein